MNLLDILYPMRCPLCRKIVKKTNNTYPLCPECSDTHEKNRQNLCVKPDFLPENEILFCAYSYTDELREAVIKYKFSGEIWMAKPFAELMFRFIKNSGGIGTFDTVTNVPVSRKRFAQRGYDQAYEIAKIIAKMSNTRYIKCLEKNEKSEDNAAMKKNRNQRNSESRYVYSGENIKGKSVLLTDDILTTGSTLRECTHLLKENGAKNVFAAVLASGRKDI